MHALQAAGWTTFCQSQWLIVWKPPRGFPNISSTQNPQWWLARVCDMFFHLRNVPLILGSKRPGGFYQIGSETQKNIKKTLRLAYGQCSSKLYLAVVLSPWVHEAHAEDRQGLCPDEIGRVQSIWFVDSICADLWWLSLHTYCPTKEKQQKQVKQKLGTLKTRVVRINVARATLMMQWCYPLELRIMMGDHPLHMVSPHVEYQPGFP